MGAPASQWCYATQANDCQGKCPTSEPLRQPERPRRAPARSAATELAVGRCACRTRKRGSSHAGVRRDRGRDEGARSRPLRALHYYRRQRHGRLLKGESRRGFGRRGTVNRVPDRWRLKALPAVRPGGGQPGGPPGPLVRRGRGRGDGNERLLAPFAGAHRSGTRNVRPHRQQMRGQVTVPHHGTVVPGFLFCCHANVVTAARTRRSRCKQTQARCGHDRQQASPIRGR